MTQSTLRFELIGSAIAAGVLGTLPVPCITHLRLEAESDRHWHEWSARAARAQRAKHQFTPPYDHADCPLKPW